MWLNLDAIRIVKKKNTIKTLSKENEKFNLKYIS